jgi:hypothetical protein
MGMQSMATAAALSFELIRRVSDVFGYVDPADEEEGAEPGGIYWEDYRPGVSITLRQHKLRRRGKAKSTQVIPLRGEPEPDADDPEIRDNGAAALSRARGRAGTHAARRTRFDRRRQADDVDRAPRRRPPALHDATGPRPTPSIKCGSRPGCRRA